RAGRAAAAPGGGRAAGLGGALADAGAGGGVPWVRDPTSATASLTPAPPRRRLCAPPHPSPREGPATPRPPPLPPPPPPAAPAPQGPRPADRRLSTVRTLNDKAFFLRPSNSLPAWEARRRLVREQVLVATGLWPLPTKTPLKPVIHGRIDRDGYSV